MVKKIIKDITKENFSFGYVLGVCNGDGYLHKAGLTVMTHSEDLGNSFAYFWNQWCGLETKTYIYQRMKQAPYQKEPTLATEYHTCANSVQVARYLMALEFGKKKHTIPKIVLNSINEEFIGGFLSGFFDSDGGVSLCRVNAHGSEQWSRKVRCFFADEIIKNQIKDLLDRLCIPAYEYYRKNRNTWELYIAKNSSIIVFSKKIGFQMKRKKEGLNKILATITQS